MTSPTIVQHSPVVEQVRRLQARDAINELAFAHHTLSHVDLLSLALEHCRLFAPEEVASVITVILDNVQYSLLEREAA